MIGGTFYGGKDFWSFVKLVEWEQLHEYAKDGKLTLDVGIEIKHGSVRFGKEPMEDLLRNKLKTLEEYARLEKENQV